MKQLVVNADDLGMTADVSRGIIEAHQHGIVTSASLLANGDAFDLALSVIEQVPRLGIGVHLNLSEGAPVSSPAAIPSLVNGKGRLHLSPAVLWRDLARKRVSLRDVETELRAQVRKVLDAGITPTHFDGHMHVHVVPGVCDLVVRIAAEQRVSAIRCPYEPLASVLGPLHRPEHFSAARNRRRAIALAVAPFAARLTSRLEKARLAYAAHFFGISKTGFLDLSCLKEILEALPDGTSELMCHPGYPAAEAATEENLPRRDVELRALTAPEIRELVAVSGIHLVTFRELARSANRAAA